MNRTDLKWLHDEDNGEDGVLEEDDGGEEFDEDEVWLRLIALIYVKTSFFLSSLIYVNK